MARSRISDLRSRVVEAAQLQVGGDELLQGVGQVVHRRPIRGIGRPAGGRQVGIGPGHARRLHVGTGGARGAREDLPD